MFHGAEREDRTFSLAFASKPGMRAALVAAAIAIALAGLTSQAAFDETEHVIVAADGRPVLCGECFAASRAQNRA